MVKRLNCQARQSIPVILVCLKSAANRHRCSKREEQAKEQRATDAKIRSILGRSHSRTRKSPRECPKCTGLKQTSKIIMQYYIHGNHANICLKKNIHAVAARLMEELLSNGVITRPSCRSIMRKPRKYNLIQQIIVYFRPKCFIRRVKTDQALGAHGKSRLLRTPGFSPQLSRTRICAYGKQLHCGAKKPHVACTDDVQIARLQKIMFLSTFQPCCKQMRKIT